LTPVPCSGKIRISGRRGSASIAPGRARIGRPLPQDSRVPQRRFRMMPTNVPLRATMDKRCPVGRDSAPAPHALKPHSQAKNAGGNGKCPTMSQKCPANSEKTLRGSFASAAATWSGAGKPQCDQPGFNAGTRLFWFDSTPGWWHIGPIMPGHGSPAGSPGTFTSLVRQIPCQA
jgi:hypothetical protein